MMHLRTETAVLRVVPGQARNVRAMVSAPHYQAVVVYSIMRSIAIYSSIGINRSYQVFVVFMDIFYDLGLISQRTKIDLNSKSIIIAEQIVKS